MKKFLRVVIFALLGSLLFGFVVGTALRLRLERLDRPARYLGSMTPTTSARSPHPFGLCDAVTVVLEPGPGEEQIAQAVQVPERVPA